MTSAEYIKSLVTPQLRNEIIDKTITAIVEDYNEGSLLSICFSLDSVLKKIVGNKYFSNDVFFILDIPILKETPTFWWPVYDLHSRVSFLKANKTAI